MSDFSNMLSGGGWAALLMHFGEPVQLTDANRRTFAVNAIVDAVETKYDDAGAGYNEIGYKVTASFVVPAEAVIEPRKAWLEHDGREYAIVSHGKRDGAISTFVVEWVEIGEIGRQQ